MCYDKLVKEIVSNDIDKVFELLDANETEIKSKMTNFNAYYLFYKVKSKEMVTVLLDYFESRNIFDISNILTSIINVAIMNGTGIDVIQRLIDKGGNINSTDMRGISPLLQSIISKRNVNFIKCIIEKGANVNEICDDDKNTILHLAVSSFCEDNYDDLEMIKLLIDYGADVNVMNLYNEIPMTKSSSTTSDDLWFELIERGTDIDERNKLNNKTNILCHALTKKGRSLELIRKLIAMGADVNAISRECRSPLYLMVVNNYSRDFFVELLRNGVNFNRFHDSSCNNPLLILSFALELNRSEEIIDLLIDYGANKSLTYYHNLTPLMCAIYQKRFDLIHRFIYESAEIDKRLFHGQTLMHAMKINDKDVIRGLIDLGADINLTDIWGRSCLLYAVMYTYDEEIINLLIDKGADIRTLNKHHDELLYSIKLTKNANNRYTVKVIENRNGKCKKKFLNYLIELNMNKKIIFDVICSGADVNAIDHKYEYTPLIRAVINKFDHDVIIKLIESGADVNLGGKDGFLPLHFVSNRTTMNGLIVVDFTSYNKELMKILVRYGANINAMNKYGKTILMGILSSDDVTKEMVSTAIELGANVNLRNNFDETPLMVAIHHFSETFIPNLEIITTLIKNGANLNDVDNRGYSAIMFALQKNYNGKDNTFRFLLDCGADLCGCLMNFDAFEDLIRGAIGREKSIENLIEVLRYKEDTFEVDTWGSVFLDNVFERKYSELLLTLFRDHINILKTDSEMINKIVSAAVDADFMDKLLNIFGIDINNVDTEGKTPLHYAVINRRDVTFIDTMIEKGAYPKWQDYNLNTPLHFADLEDVINTLIINYNADINATNIVGKIPFEWVFQFSLYVEAHCTHIKHLLLMSPELSFDQSINRRYNGYFNQCKTELDEMKRTNIINDLSYYKFCCKSSKQEKRLVLQSEDLFTCKKNEIAKFPIYKSIIIMRVKIYRMSIVKKKLLNKFNNRFIESNCANQTEDKLCVLNNCDEDGTSDGGSENGYLNFDVLECITKYLSGKNMIKLMLGLI